MRAYQRKDETADKSSASSAPPGRQRRPIFVINLKQDAKRLAFMQRQLAGMNLTFEVIEAVDGRAVPEEERQKMTAGSLQCILPNELGCYLSHRKAHQIMAERNIPEALILEDDVLLNEDFAEVVNGCELPQECRILQLIAKEADAGYEHARLALHLSSRTRPLPRGYKMSCYIGVLYCAHAYILRLPYARRLAAEMLPMKVRTDHRLFDWRHCLYLPWVAYKKSPDGKYRTLGKEAPVADKRPENRAYRDSPAYKKTLALHELRGHIRAGGGGWPARNKKRPPPVFVLRLEQSGDRLAAIKRELDRARIPFEIVDAAENDDEKRVSGKTPPQNSSAADRRYLAHVEAYRAALKTGAAEAVILEDGASLDEDFPAWFHGAPLKRRQTPGMIYYGRHDPPIQLFSPCQAKPLAHQFDPDFPADRDVIVTIRKFYAQAYMIQRSQMRKLLKKKQPAAASVQALLFRSRIRIFHRVQHYALTTLRKAVQLCLLRCPALLNCKEKSVERPLGERAASAEFLRITFSLCSFPGLRRIKRSD